MNPNVTTILSPKGDVLVVMPLADFERLSAAAVSSVLANAKGLSQQTGDDSKQPESAPGEVQIAIKAGVSPLTAWRHYRQMSKSELARASGVSRFTVMRIESAGAGAGNRKSRLLLAKALNVPASAL